MRARGIGMFQERRNEKAPRITTLSGKSATNKQFRAARISALEVERCDGSRIQPEKHSST
jgi:hypothetical protein